MRTEARWVVALMAGLLVASDVPIGRQQREAAIITLDRSREYQTITGWEAVSNGGHLAANRRLFQPALFDAAVNDLGINRLRLEIASGTEHGDDAFADWQAGRLDTAKWRAARYATENDNRDARKIDWAGFHFTAFDLKVDEVVNPIRALLKARGEELFVIVTYVAFTIRNGVTRTVHEDPDEYAEFVLATYLHLQQKYGWVPDAWEVILEPDNGTNWSGVGIGRAVAASAARLRDAGFTPRFIVPSTMSAARAVPYFDAVYSVPAARPFLFEFSYHRYTGASEAVVRAIADRARERGIATAMLEKIESDYRDLHQDLKVGNVSAWEQYVLAPVGASSTEVNPASNGTLFLIDSRDPEKPVVVMMHAAKYFRQYFRHVRRGARRIEAATTDPRFDPVAFVNTGGGTVVVVMASEAGEFSIASLPAGRYGIFHTTMARHETVALADVAVAEGGVLRTRIPGRGVLTVHAK